MNWLQGIFDAFSLWWADLLEQNPNLLGDVLVPSSAILVSTVVALSAVAAQRHGQLQQRRFEAVANLRTALDRMRLEAELKLNEKQARMDLAWAEIETRTSVLRLILPKRQRVVPAIVRAHMYGVAIHDPHSTRAEMFDYIHKTQHMGDYLEAWAVGGIGTSKFRKAHRLLGVGGNSTASDLVDLWDDYMRRAIPSIGNSEHGITFTREMLEEDPVFKYASKVTKHHASYEHLYPGS